MGYLERRRDDWRQSGDEILMIKKAVNFENQGTEYMRIETTVQMYKGETERLMFEEAVKVTQVSF